MARLRDQLPVAAGMNVILISFDALRPDALGVYGHDRGTSPNIDRTAERCTVFEHAYSVAPVTPTSFAAAFTGMLPTRVFHAWQLVFDDTLAKRFQQAGYRTAAFFNSVQLTPERGFDSGFEVYELHPSKADEPVLESALGWLEAHAADRLFAWIHLLTPHAPYEYREESSHLYEAGYEGEFETTSTGRFETDDPRAVARLRSLYDGEVFHGDRLFGRLMDALRDLGLLRRSLLVLTSDHGEEFYEHGGFQHDRLYEEHVRIPMIVCHPEVRTALRSELLVSNVDLFPTLLSVTGLAGGGPRDGRDWTRLERAPDQVVGVSMTGAGRRWLSLRRGELKLIQTCLPDRAQELFELGTDPDEKVDLLAERPREARSLYRELGQILGGEPCDVMMAAVRGAEATVGLDEEQIEILKGLGYLGD